MPKKVWEEEKMDKLVKENGNKSQYLMITSWGMSKDRMMNILKEKNPQMYLELIINKTINTEIEDLMKASEIAYQQIKKLVAVEYPEPLELSFIQKLSLSKMKQDMVQKKMMEWLMNQPLIKNRPTYI